jgi:hypothetical protein
MGKVKMMVIKANLDSYNMGKVVNLNEDDKPWEGFEVKVLEFFALNPNINSCTAIMWGEIVDNHLSEDES